MFNVEWSMELMMNWVRSDFFGWRFFLGIAVVHSGIPILFIVRQMCVISVGPRVM